MWLAVRLSLSAFLIVLAEYLAVNRSLIFAYVMMPVAVIIAVGALIVHRAERGRMPEPATEGRGILDEDQPAKVVEPQTAAFLERLGDPLASGLNIPAIIEYRDSAGYKTERAITINTVYGDRLRGGAVRLSVVRAYCHLRRDNRTFYVSRMLNIADAETGELGDEPATWICGRAGILGDRFEAGRAG